MYIKNKQKHNKKQNPLKNNNPNLENYRLIGLPELAVIFYSLLLKRRKKPRTERFNKTKQNPATPPPPPKQINKQTKLNKNNYVQAKTHQDANIFEVH